MPYIEDFIPTEAPPVQPNMGFLNRALEENKAWGGGKPTTKEGQEFVLNYLTKFGQAPSPKQVAEYKKGMGDTNLSYLPESPMGQLGFETEAQSLDWRSGRAGPYGPLYEERFAASQPESLQGMGIEEILGRSSPQEVYKARLEDYLRSQMQRDEITLRQYQEQMDALQQQDEDIRLGFRNQFAQGQEAVGGLGTFDLTEIEKLIQDADTTIAELEGKTGIFRSGKPKQVQADLDRWQQYRGQLQSALDQATQQNQKVADYIKGVRAAEGQVPQALQQWELYRDNALAKLDAAMGGLMSPERAQGLVNQAQLILDRGDLEGLPLMKEIAGSLGPLTSEIYNRILKENREAIEAARPKSFGEQVTMQGMAMPRGGRGTSFTLEGYEPRETGTEQRDYYTAVQQQGLAPEAEQYAMNQFSKYYYQWQQTGAKQPFMQWLNEQLGGG